MVAGEDELHPTLEGNLLSQSNDSGGEEMLAHVGTRSFIPLPLRQDRKDTAIRSAAINGFKPVLPSDERIQEPQGWG